MTIPTVAVTCTAFDQNGNAVAGALFHAKLDQTEIYNGFVVPEIVEGVADANGVLVLNLWPNALGVAGSVYRITARNPDTGRKFIDATAVVPNSACNLHNILSLETFPNVAEISLDQLSALLAAATASAAAALASLNDFKGRYYGAFASDPTVDPLGAAPTTGDLYFNTTLSAMKVYTTGAVWQNYEVAAAASAAVASAQASSASTSASNASTSASTASTQASAAAASAATATAQATLSTNAKVASEAARDASSASATASEVSRLAAGVSAGVAAAAKVSAETARDGALLSRGVFATTAKALSKGVVGSTSLVAGSGGTNGTFALGVSGGSGSGAAGVFVVAAGVVVAGSILFTAAGDSYTSAPALSFAASAGLTGASATAVIGNNVDPGEYFSTPGAGASAALDFWQNSAGSAVPQKSYPSTAAFDFSQKTLRTLFAVSDADGNLGVSIDSPLIVDSLGGVKTTTVEVSKKDLNNQLAFADADGNVILAVDSLGRLVANFALAPIPSSLLTGGVFDYEVNHIFQYGQSLSVGQATPVMSTVQAYDNLMFVRGMRPQYDYTGEVAAQWYASMVPAVEALSPINPILAETPCMGMGDAIKQRIFAENGLAYTAHKYQLMLSAPGYGSTTIAQLSKGAGTGHYERVIEQATYGLALSNAAGKTYAAQAVTWTQGESDYISNTTQAAYVASLNTLIGNFDTDLRAATGQAKSVPMISYQLASHKVAGRTVPTIALGLLEVEAANALAYISTPMYHFDYQDTSNYHLTPESSRWLGAYHGLAYKRIVIDGVDWKPLKPLSSIKQGAIATVKFNVPRGSLVLDTTLVAANTNSGFELVDSGGSALTISSVVIMGPNTVKVIAAATIPAGAKLRYGWSGSGNVGNAVGPRGNLRDSQGDTIVFDPTGINKPMHNWCVIFEIGL